jgi:site-specific DNA-cytosine methylase
MGVEGKFINSNLVSAQNRQRWYWTNIQFNNIEDKHIYLNDILESESEIDAKYYIKAGRLSWLNKFGELKEKNGYVYFTPSEAKCLTVQAEPSCNRAFIIQWPHGSNRGGFRSLDKTPALTASAWEHNNLLLKEGMVRKLTPLECERLQTVPDNYTNCVSDAQRYKMLGNGWTVDVIVEIFKGLK